jgi:hypothetical protein
VVSAERARELAEESIRGKSVTLAPGATELDRGWYFGLRHKEILVGGYHGLVVSKETGSIYLFGGARGLERSLRLYDRGLDAHRHDLVITAVHNLEGTVTFLQEIAPSVVEPSYDHGTVWRIARDLTEDEIRNRLSSLPALFPDVALYHTFEAVEEARSGGCCVLKLFPRRD